MPFFPENAQTLTSIYTYAKSDIDLFIRQSVRILLFIRFFYDSKTFLFRLDSLRFLLK